jgi:hypothetical protein
VEVLVPTGQTQLDKQVVMVAQVVVVVLVKGVVDQVALVIPRQLHLRKVIMVDLVVLVVATQAVVVVELVLLVVAQVVVVVLVELVVLVLHLLLQVLL